MRLRPRPRPAPINPAQSLQQHLTDALQRHQEAGLTRSRRVLGSPQGPEIRIGGRSYVAFCSNDYLGLANHPRVTAAMQRAVRECGVGSGASHLITGHHAAHHALEEELAAFVGSEAAVLFSTGYMANLCVAAVLLGRRDTVFSDRLNHASLVDAARLSGARQQRYRHADPAHLETLLAADPGSNKLVLTDGVFSMDGDFAPLPALTGVANRANAWLMVDDAHGLGVVGPEGRGSCAHFALGQNDIPILMGTLGKALGVFGAFVAGSRALTEAMIQFGRTYTYTTALPPAVAEAARESLRVLAEEDWRRAHLQDLVLRFRRGAANIGLAITESPTPIQPVILGSAEAAVSLSRQLEERGIYVPAIRPPTVPKGTARLRVTFSAAHSPEHVDRLLNTLAELSP